MRLFMLFSGLLSLFQAQDTNKIEVLDVTAFKQAVSQGKVQLVDVRTPREYNGSHIQGAINIDFYKKIAFDQSFNQLDKEQPVYIYCHSGGRSKMASRRLVKMGFTKVYDLQGGYVAWNR